MSKLTNNYLPEILALGFRRSGPSMVGVNLTNRCNQRCIYCEIGAGDGSIREKTLSVEDLHWIIDEMAKNRIPKISLCGGEPFLFPGLMNVIAYANTKHIRCSVTTNGMTAHRLGEDDLATLKECKTEINVSIDSFEENIMSMTRGTPEALPNALKSIQQLRDKGIPVTLLVAVSIFNYHDLFNFFTRAYETGIRQVLFQPIIYHSNYPEIPAIENKAQLNVGEENLGVLMDELAKILRFERTHQINSNVYRILPWIESYIKSVASAGEPWFFQHLLKKFYCREIYAIIDISYYGGIQPCGLARASTTIHEDRDLGLLALWSAATAEIKDDLSHGRYYSICNSCCHHFSRNMLASIAKYPVRNRKMMGKVIRFAATRMFTRMINNL